MVAVAAASSDTIIKRPFPEPRRLTSKHDLGHRIPRPQFMPHLAVLQGVGESVLEDGVGVEEQ